MKPFRFRLATLLRLREAARDRHRANLAQAFEADDVLQQRRTQLADEVGHLERRNRTAGSAGPIEVDALIAAQRYTMILQAEDRMIAQQREVVAEEIERRRQQLVAADRDLKVLEKLREKHLLRHRKEQDL
ncbi:MAG: hypothetical protein IID33_13360, partial [Planctomycetes bacterium]|nr:hypothetical protein [Planctomycetota bacterium]